MVDLVETEVIRVSITPPARKPIAVLHVELLGRGPEARGLGAAGPLSAMD
jgi:hypothetical protein